MSSGMVFRLIVPCLVPDLWYVVCQLFLSKVTTAFTFQFGTSPQSSDEISSRGSDVLTNSSHFLPLGIGQKSFNLISG